MQESADIKEKFPLILRVPSPNSTFVERTAPANLFLILSIIKSGVILTYFLYRAAALPDGRQ